LTTVSPITLWGRLDEGSQAALIYYQWVVRRRTSWCPPEIYNGYAVHSVEPNITTEQADREMRKKPHRPARVK